MWVMISGIAFDRPHHLSRLSEHFYMIDRPDCPDKTQFYPSDLGHLSHPGCLRLSGL